MTLDQHHHAHEPSRLNTRQDEPTWLNTYQDEPTWLNTYQDEPTWLNTHQHNPNPAPPDGDGTLYLQTPSGKKTRLSPTILEEYPQTTVADCYIVSTGHGTTGPFTFSGVRLDDLLKAYIDPADAWEYVDIISADGFGNRVYAAELRQGATAHMVLLALKIDDQPMHREQGLVRMIVPSETDDALRQVKWIDQIIVYPSPGTRIK